MEYKKGSIWFEHQPSAWQDITHYNGDILRLKVAVENIWIDPAHSFIKIPKAYILTYKITQQVIYDIDGNDTGETREVETLVTERDSPFAPRMLKDPDGKQKVLTNDYKVNPETFQQDDNGVGEYFVMSKLNLSSSLDLENMTKEQIGQVEILDLLKGQIQFWIDLMYQRGSLKMQ